MAKRGPLTQAKRQRELAKKAKRQAKLERRELRKELKAYNAAQPNEPGVDPDIAGIVPGPQPPLTD